MPRKLHELTLSPYGSAAERQGTRSGALPRRDGFLAALEPQHRRAVSPLHRTRARPSVVRRLGFRLAGDDGRRLSRPRPWPLSRDVPGRGAAQIRRVLVRWRDRGESGPAARAAGDAPMPGLAGRLSLTPLRRPADPELQGSRERRAAVS